MQQGPLLYQGKVKSLYQTDDPRLLLAHFSDKATAFNGVKKAVLPEKGRLNNLINAHLMSLLAHEGIATHHVECISDDMSLVKALEMVPVECVVRNVTAGSLCKRLGIEKGKRLAPPLFEFFLKDDALGDPLVTEAHILLLNLATRAELKTMQAISLQVNDILSKHFEEVGLVLVDFKLEFGKLDGKLILGDEITPDGCRIWEKDSGEILDKDRFRQDLGDVVSSYQLIADKLGVDTTVVL